MHKCIIIDKIGAFCVGSIMVANGMLMCCVNILSGGICRGMQEEVMLREQDYGNFHQHDLLKQVKEERLKYSRFYYRFPQGESAGRHGHAWLSGVRHILHTKHALTCALDVLAQQRSSVFI